MERSLDGIALLLQIIIGASFLQTGFTRISSILRLTSRRSTESTTQETLLAVISYLMVWCTPLPVSVGNSPRSPSQERSILFRVTSITVATSWVSIRLLTESTHDFRLESDGRLRYHIDPPGIGGILIGTTDTGESVGNFFEPDGTTSSLYYGVGHTFLK